MTREAGLSDVTLLALTGILGRRGGAERAFLSLTEGFAERLGMSVRLAAHLPPEDPELRERAFVLRPAGQSAGLSMVARARSWIAEAPPGAILFPFQLNSNVVAGCANASLPRGRCLPVVSNDRAAISEMTSPARVGGAGAYGVLRSRVLTGLVRFTYGRSAAVVCNARANADLVRALLGEGSPPVETIYNPLDVHGLQARFAARDRVGLQSPKGPLIAAHGRLDRQKGFDVLLEALARIRTRRPDVRLRIVGEGEEREALAALASRLGIADAVEWPGFSTDPVALVEPADLYVLPSRFEGLPNSLLEAIAVGLPCIAADCPTGPAEILGRGGEAGRLFPVDDVAALTAAIDGLLDDTAGRASLAAAARRRALAFAPEVAIDAYAAIFRRILGR